MRNTTREIEEAYMNRYSGQRCVRKDLIKETLDISDIQFYWQKLSDHGGIPAKALNMYAPCFVNTKSVA